MLRNLAELLAQESIVLLKNTDHFLPLAKNRKVAFLGRSQLDTIYSGNGSGAAHTLKCKSILAECEKYGLLSEPTLKKFYQDCIIQESTGLQNEFEWSALGTNITSGIMYEIFGKYHAPVDEYLIDGERLQKARAFTDTAILILGRNSGGEECDRHLVADYYLTDTEKKMIDQTCCTFSNVILILNINGMIDLKWTMDYTNIKSILFMGIAGEKGSSAVAKLLIGDSTPSGKLAFTIAQQYEDYPSARHFSWNKEHEDELLTYENYEMSSCDNGSSGFAKSPVTVYHEDLFVGYRYFDTFNKKPLYPFGFGLSYTDFKYEKSFVNKKIDGFEIVVFVKNTGEANGKEVIQIYLENSMPEMNCPLRELKSFQKTKLLKPGETERLEMFLPWSSFSHYEESIASWLIKRGNYRIMVGNSSKDVYCAANVIVSQDIITEKCCNRLSLKKCNQNKLSFCKRTEIKLETGSILELKELSETEKFWIYPEDMSDCYKKYDKIISCTEKNTIRKFVENLSEIQLAALCVGYGPGTPFSAFSNKNDPETICDENGNPVTENDHCTGANGYVSPAISHIGIHSVFYKDGPAGIGETAWPSGMLLACSFDQKLWYQFGNEVGKECEKQKVDIWLAPAVNLIRHPLCGRNFEYFSEDPYLTGMCACAITKGVQENHSVLACPKHFAVNEQETFRRGCKIKNIDAVDSVIREAAARELYLKPFEMLVKDARISCVMTAFNKINGVFCAANNALCNEILREEWGYNGVVISDWGDMDIVADGADAIAAGNDIVMPGGPPVIKQILKGIKEKRVQRKQLIESVTNLIYVIQKTKGGKYGKDKELKNNIEIGENMRRKCKSGGHENEG